jgi:hypothetical protein
VSPVARQFGINSCTRLFCRPPSIRRCPRFESQVGSGRSRRDYDSAGPHIAALSTICTRAKAAMQTQARLVYQALGTAMSQALRLGGGGLHRLDLALGLRLRQSAMLGDRRGVDGHPAA